MSIENWDKSEIKSLALASGKPLEVQCAEAFLRAGWEVHLGTFYNDIASEKIRELDVLIYKKHSEKLRDAGSALVEWNISLRILASCKGFAPEHAPASFSVAGTSPSVQKPCFMLYECSPRSTGVVESLSRQAASRFLNRAHLSGGRQIVGFDILQRKETKKNPPNFEYGRKTDRDLYEGLDSAIKSALFWQEEDRRQGRNRFVQDRGDICLNIPLLVSSLPFWDTAIDGGQPSEPELTSKGYHVSLFPSSNEKLPPHPIMSIVWEAGKLEELTQQMYDLFDFFIDEVMAAARRT